MEGTLYSFFSRIGSRNTLRMKHISQQEDVEYSSKIGFNGFKTAGPCFSAREFKINVGYNHAALSGHILNTGALVFMVTFGLCTAISTVVSDEVGFSEPLAANPATRVQLCIALFAVLLFGSTMILLCTFRGYGSHCGQTGRKS